MKVRLVPVYFKSGKDAVFAEQVETLWRSLSEEADILNLVAPGSALPDAEPVMFPQISGDAYQQVKLGLPLLTITSESGYPCTQTDLFVKYLTLKSRRFDMEH